MHFSMFQSHFQHRRHRRGVAAAALLGVVLLLVSACATADNAADPVPERSRSDLATVQARSPMVRATTVAATEVAGATATAHTAQSEANIRRTPTPRVTESPTMPVAGSDRSTPSAPANSTAPPSVTSAPPPPADQGDPLFAALLQRTDLNDGIWTTSPNTSVPYLELCDALPIDIAYDIAWVSSVSFVSTRGGDLQQWVYYAPGVAEEVMDYLHSAFACATFSYPYYVDNEMRLSDLPTTLLGQQPFGRQFELDFTEPSYNTMSGTVTVTREGDFITALLHVEYSSFDPAVSARYLERALTRLQTMPPTVLPEPTVPIF